MSLEVQQYSRLDRTFKKVAEVGPGSNAGYVSVKGRGEMVSFECEQDDSGSTIYRCNWNSTENEVIKRLNKGEAFGLSIARARPSKYDKNPEPTLYNIIHR